MALDLKDMDWPQAAPLIQYTLELREADAKKSADRHKELSSFVDEIYLKLSGFMLRASLIAAAAGIIGSVLLPRLAEVLFPLASAIFGSPAYASTVIGG